MTYHADKFVVITPVLLDGGFLFFRVPPCSALAVGHALNYQGRYKKRDSKSEKRLAGKE
ncbi:hypothetical protein [Photobacterium phosphoreum]|uniref:hypothetical protein n=1 Tax=Photobacterium phosphoreum TaxID=659 RepID=UPI0015E78CD5|nr:hypothetical protein [Photobacterium phosphoreum]